MKRAMIIRGILVVTAVLAAVCTVTGILLFRAGQPQWVWIPVLSSVIALAVAAAYLICAARTLERRLMKPMNMVLSSLRGITGGAYISAATDPLYANFSPQIAEMYNLSRGISKKLAALADERDKIVYTLDNMSEGLVVVAGDLTIQLINKSAIDYFGVTPDIRGQNLLRLTHLPKTVEAVRKAAATGEHDAFDVYTGQSDRVLQILISPIHGVEPGTRSGAIMLITDVTAVRRAEQIRSDFVANASHELKTPLTSIKGFAELLQSGMVEEPEKRDRYLDLIRQETDRMIVLISDILKLSELESVVSDTGRSQISLRFIAQRVADSLALQAQGKAVAISVGGDAGMLTANPDRMTELILNLVDNAVKYNKPGGRVNVRVTQADGYVVLEVADTGVGIPEEAKERVFERFYRVDKSRSRKQGGTGLGLAIVKHITELYKGTIRLESTLDKGTTITVTLPEG